MQNSEQQENEGANLVSHKHVMINKQHTMKRQCLYVTWAATLGYKLVITCHLDIFGKWLMYCKSWTAGEWTEQSYLHLIALF